jgi:hypothetical protein
MDNEVCWKLTPTNQSEGDEAILTLQPVLSPNLGHITSQSCVEFTKTGICAMDMDGVTSLTPYKSIKTAVHNEVPGAEAIYRDLAERFPGAPRKKP